MIQRLYTAHTTDGLITKDHFIQGMAQLVNRVLFFFFFDVDDIDLNSRAPPCHQLTHMSLLSSPPTLGPSNHSVHSCWWQRNLLNISTCNSISCFLPDETHQLTWTIESWRARSRRNTPLWYWSFASLGWSPSSTQWTPFKEWNTLRSAWLSETTNQRGREYQSTNHRGLCKDNRRIGRGKSWMGFI